MATDRIEQEIHIQAPRQRVWQLLTEAEHISRWFGDSTEVDLRAGGKMTFTWGGQFGSHHAQVERVDPPAFFSYRWARRTEEEPVEGNSTLVEFTLTEAGAGTLLRVVETGFDALKATEPEKDAAAGANIEGWRNELAELRHYAEASGP
jgi:uncharacterized protein YndB with AHSA1/START domain